MKLPKPEKLLAKPVVNGLAVARITWLAGKAIRRVEKASKRR